MSDLVVPLAYGQGFLPVALPADRTTVIEPVDVPGLADERAAVLSALRRPVGRPPLREVVRGARSVCIAFTDVTRATPNERLIPWLLEEVAEVPRDRVVLLSQTGTHRPHTRAELERLLTPAVVRDHRVVDHEPRNPAALVRVGTTRDGTPATVNRHLVEADVRIVTGFVEPHLFAGFSGGPKGIVPGCAGQATVESNHGRRHIGDPRASFGVTEGNPLWEELRDLALRVGESFLVNVTLNVRRELTGVFAGDLLAAHREAIEAVRRTAMRRVDAPFDVVVTTNSGSPLDLNLYQGVKGMAAGARIVRDGGTVVLACECREGVPEGSAFETLLREATSPDEVLARLSTPGFARPDQWQAQILAGIRRRARVLLRSSLPDDAVRGCHLEPCPDVGAAVRAELARLGPRARVAVLPHGPLTVPYVA